MKNKFFFTSVFIIMLSQFLIAQENKIAYVLSEFNNDTAKYIGQRILSDRNSYIGKPLDSLLKDLPTIVNYANGDVPRNVSICPATVLFFSSYQRTLDKLDQKEFPMVLVITWAAPLYNNELPSRGLNIGGGKWTEAVYNYYKNKIVDKIETIEYTCQQEL
jgi:hypothetical protein